MGMTFKITDFGCEEVPDTNTQRGDHNECQSPNIASCVKLFV